MERVAAIYREKILSPQQAAEKIRSGMTLAMSGFTLVGYPKAVPLALAESGHADDLTICVGASVGDELDGALTRAGLVRRRFAYQSNRDMRAAINAGTVGYSDMHISHFPRQIAEGVGPKIDFAIVECSAVTEDGLIPTASVGCMDAIVRAADKVIVEVNETLPLDLFGMHDIFEIGLPPRARPLNILSPTDRIGTPFLPCPPEKIAAIVLTDRPDQPASFKPLTPVTARIGQNVVSFLKGEVAAGRLPEGLGPIQSGVGSVGNAVLQALNEGGFRGLEMYTEVMQDAALGLMDRGVFARVSASAVSLEEATRRRFYENLTDYHDRIVIRPQEISNHPEVIRRLGVIALNTPIELDIYGNVNSTHIMGSSVMNGIGGSGDFTLTDAAGNVYSFSPVQY